MLRQLLLTALAAAAVGQSQGALQYVRSSNGLLDFTMNIVRGPALIGGSMVNNTITFNGCVHGGWGERVMRHPSKA